MVEKVDSDILSFLRAIYFGSYNNPYQAVASRAYLDMNRTIRFKGLEDDIRLALREQVNKMLESDIKAFLVSSQADYDAWHKET